MHDAALLRDWIAGNTDSTFGQGRYILDAFVHHQPASELLFNGRFELGFGGWTAFEDGVPFIPWQSSLTLVRHSCLAKLICCCSDKTG